MKKLLLLMMIAMLALACRKEAEVTDTEVVGRTDTTVEVPTANMNEPAEPFTTTTPAIPAPTATTATAAPAPIPPPIDNKTVDDMPRVTAAELQDLLRQNKAVVVDVRLEPQYKAGHIPGAVHIQWNHIPARLSELPRDKTLVFYCT